MLSPEEQLAQLRVGSAKILSDEELLKKLNLGRPLRVKLGVDPTAPDIHLGHSVSLSKLRQFQDLGHQAILIIGDFTSMIGDPSGRSTTRPQLTHDEVMANAKTYTEQAFKILDRERTTIAFNGEWFEMMSFQEVIKLNSRVTLQQMLQREDFKERMEKNQPVRAHEIQYPIMQGWDSVKVQADVEIGGTDQLFNILVGRDLQKEEGQPQQVALMVPILEGLDGVQKMSKSLNNYIGVSEDPVTMLGKVMSISDELMARWYELLFQEKLDSSSHPMDAKKSLARRLVERFHTADEAEHALQDFNTRFSARKLADSDTLPVLDLSDVSTDIIAIVVAAYERGFQLTKSKSDARRLIEGGSVQLAGQKIADLKIPVELESNQVLKLDKTRAIRIR